MKKKIFISFFVLVFALVAGVGIAMNVSKTMVVSHTLNTPMEKAWYLFNDPTLMQEWWGPDGFTAPVIKNEPVVGGKILLSMRDKDGKDYFNVGRYIEVRQHELLVSMLSFADNAGNPVPAKYYEMPGNWPDEIKVSARFDEQDGKTTIEITEEGIPAIMYVFAKMGWEQQFKKMDRFLNKQPVIGR